MQALQSVCYVYVVDEAGMREIFIELKQMLVSQPDTHTTLVYCSAEDNFIFSKELDILQKRFPAQLIVYLVKRNPVDASTLLQEFLEAIINANTSVDLLFVLSGDEELIHVVSDRLWFLGIHNQQIKIWFLR
jgi:hypothetical protein